MKPFFTYSLLMLSLILLGSPANLAAASPEKNDLSRLLTQLERKGELNWKLAYNYDPYAEGVVMRTSPKHPCTLQLSANGFYERKTDQQHLKGRWEVVEGENLIRFICLEINGKKVSNQPIEHYLSVNSYSHGVMILAWQGRHGSVEEVYQPVVPIESGKMSLPQFSLR